MLERQAHVRASYVLYLIRFLPHTFLIKCPFSPTNLRVTKLTRFFII